MELPDLTRAPGRGLPPPPPARGDPAPRTGIRDGDSQGPPWSRSRCWRDRRRLQKTLTPSTGSQITWRETVGSALIPFGFLYCILQVLQAGSKDSRK
ncbi:protein dpy-30 homolog isoform X5 [Pipistrellus kuhlii]|uniref:protein dpy-30 homolog isoform X5 n=1 Tax=Pipistrellus kuhlii TaxID=59472 RepID=UPI001E2721A6|nr:protein dpy-30 homolog isoform X5 [Pipistrellus kuhlii]